MAEDVISAPTPAEPELPLQLAPTRGDRARKSSYRLRFGIIYVALAAIVGAGVGTFVVLASRPAPPEAAAWSSWEPTGSKLHACARSPTGSRRRTSSRTESS